MIEFKTGDILQEDAEALVNSVNCVGVMGRGIALQFRHAFPSNYKAYVAACKKHEVQPGSMFVYEVHGLANPRYIINFPTKRHWRSNSKIEDIKSGLIDLANLVHSLDIRSIAIPPLGSGLGGLEWSAVRPLIEEAMQGLAHTRVIVFEPLPGSQAVNSRASTRRKQPSMTPGRAALVGLIERYVAGLLDPFVSLLEVHKLMYFLQEADEELKLRYVKGPYGPYAENLRHVLDAIEGHLVSGYADGGDQPDKQLTLVPGAASDARAFLGQQPDTQARFDRVASLVDGFESPAGLELIATVHWIAKDSAALDPAEIIDETHAWSAQKRRFTERQIRLAIAHLSDEGWLAGRSA